METFIESSRRSLKAVLLCNGNKCSSILIGNSLQIKETHCNIDQLLAYLNCYDHGWLICGDLKVVGLFHGLQCGYTKYPCFLCLWNSRTDNGLIIIIIIIIIKLFTVGIIHSYKKTNSNQLFTILKI